MEPEFNERRHSESVVKSRNHLGELLLSSLLIINNLHLFIVIPRPSGGGKKWEEYEMRP